MAWIAISSGARSDVQTHHTPTCLDHRRAFMNIARITLTAGVLAGVLCGGAMEAAAQEQQPIFGCVKPGTGQLRIPPPNEGCKGSETPMGFNDFPLLVALRTQVEQLQAAVTSLQTAVTTLQSDVLDLQERLTKVEACTDGIPEC